MARDYGMMKIFVGNSPRYAEYGSMYLLGFMFTLAACAVFMIGLLSLTGLWRQAYSGKVSGFKPLKRAWSVLGSMGAIFFLWLVFNHGLTMGFYFDPAAISDGPLTKSGEIMQFVSRTGRDGTSYFYLEQGALVFSRDRLRDIIAMLVFMPLIFSALLSLLLAHLDFFAKRLKGR